MTGELPAMTGELFAVERELPAMTGELFAVERELLVAADRGRRVGTIKKK
jgi:hypothetical protein